MQTGERARPFHARHHGHRTAGQQDFMHDLRRSRRRGSARRQGADCLQMPDRPGTARGAGDGPRPSGLPAEVLGVDEQPLAAMLDIAGDGRGGGLFIAGAQCLNHQHMRVRVPIRQAAIIEM